MDKFELLKQYKDLLEQQIITQEEFDEKKKEILNEFVLKVLSTRSFII